MELDLVKSVLFHPLADSVLGEHFFHATLSNSLGVENVEELSVLVYSLVSKYNEILTFLHVVSVLNNDQGRSAGLFSELDDVEEGSLGELVD